MISSTVSSKDMCDILHVQRTPGLAATRARLKHSAVESVRERGLVGLLCLCEHFPDKDRCKGSYTNRDLILVPSQRLSVHSIKRSPSIKPPPGLHMEINTYQC